MQKTKYPKRPTTQRHYEAIRAEYRRLSEITEYGKPKYAYERILAASSDFIAEISCIKQLKEIR